MTHPPHPTHPPKLTDPGRPPHVVVWGQSAPKWLGSFAQEAQKHLGTEQTRWAAAYNREGWELLLWPDLIQTETGWELPAHRGLDLTSLMGLFDNMTCLPHLYAQNILSLEGVVQDRPLELIFPASLEAISTIADSWPWTSQFLDPLMDVYEFEKDLPR